MTSRLNRMYQVPHVEQPVSRRDMLCRSGAGFGSVALAGLLSDDARVVAAGNSAPTASSGLPHHFVGARSVIFLFMEGGPSQMDTFDPKPELNRLAGQPLPGSFKPVITPMGEYNAPLLPSQRKWKQHGECGMWVSDWLPRTAQCADDIAVLRGCWTNGI
ncbi:MAG: DUF1501 domain-containing protein, partial [Planctomycetaceae bacterium]